MSKSAPVSPGADKKNVHFAEGEDLVNVKTYVPSYDDLDALRKVFLQEMPLKTNEGEWHGKNSTDAGDEEDAVPVTRFKHLKGSSTLLAKSFRIVRTFSRESDCLSAMYDKVKPDEMDALLEKNNICLVDTKLNERSVTGFIMVNNLAYHKSVTVRHTFDNWGTVFNTPAYYILSSDEGRKDKFGFNLTFPPDRMELSFALQYVVNGQEYWDNNHGNNYRIVEYISLPPSS